MPQAPRMRALRRLAALGIALGLLAPAAVPASADRSSASVRRFAPDRLRLARVRSLPVGWRADTLPPSHLVGPPVFL